MTKAKKRLLTLLLAMLMAVGMAVPTFATEIDPRFISGVSYTSNGNRNYQLNAATSATPTANTLVTMWQNTGHPTQRWAHISYPGTDYFWIENSANHAIVLSYNGYPQARLATKDTSSYGQYTQAIKMINEGRTSEGYLLYGLALPQYLLAVTATGYYNGAQAQWQGSNGTNNQLWLTGLYP